MKIEVRLNGCKAFDANAKETRFICKKSGLTNRRYKKATQQATCA